MDIQDGLTLNLDDILSFRGASLPIGVEVPVRLIDVSAKQIGKNGPNPAVVAKFEVTEGEYRGIEVEKLYFVSIRTSAKTGRPYSLGLGQLKADVEKVGRTDVLPRSFSNPVDGEALKKAYHKAFAGRKMLLRQSERQYESNGEKKTARETEIRPVPVVGHEAQSEASTDDIV